ncbi:putative trehalose-phosphate phosphatase F [Sesamum angolense]|uniref:Trehalose-phosphate phosphatase F n=1 Tax=Sesamum angolense TaxID=2727404 RepID=A0AAE2BL73_9LAMI|nr:putative trehalose-phosphate phosphatase F [Sesamum angolense]
MDLKSTNASPVLADPAPINKPRLGIHSSLLPYSQSGSSFSTSILTRKKPAKLDDVRSNGWLDAMQSSSPPRKKALKDVNNINIVSDEAEIAYQSWLVRYPSALNSFQMLMDRARNRKLVMFLDYDGTLSPIVDDPDRAFMSSEMRSALNSVAKHFPTAIISGRSRDKSWNGHHVPAKDMVSKNHVNCVKYTDSEGKEVNLFQPASEFLPVINEVFRKLDEIVRDIKGLSSIAPNSWAKGFGGPSHNRLGQRKAVEFLLESLGFSSSDVLPIYIGDDRTDEDAFKVLRERNRGYGILVSAVPKESNAFFSLRDTSEVQGFLESLVRMARDDGRMKERRPEPSGYYTD